MQPAYDVRIACVIRRQVYMICLAAVLRIHVSSEIVISTLTELEHLPTR